MSNEHSGNMQNEISREEHDGGLNAKRVAIASAPSIYVDATPVPLSYYNQSSLISGYVWHGFTNPGNTANTATFKILRETLNTGEILFASGRPTFLNTWSAASLASITYQ